AAPILLVAAALGAAFAVSRGGRSRESLLPVSRAVAEHAKGLDRGSAIVFPLSADEERAIGEKIDADLRRASEPPPGTPGASRAALWKELGLEAAGSPLVKRFRGRYEFRAVDRGGVNAFAVPGGFVYATDGLLEKLQKDPDALLFTLGHEIGHIELGHCADAYRLRAGAKDPLRALLGGVILVPRLLASLHFSPSQELEADAYAARLLRSLERDPAAGLRTFDALGLKADAELRRGPGRVAVEGLSDYFRTHPGSWERRAALEREAARAP
ncbi:MAG: M48 family metallopeptidase, partial [Elusimicrobia bacterium]|nr:M48 family metallopeptidase [Elusimicrobiota bacterium]